MSQLDLHIIFPPQWSPFQPFLSLPSLKAYLTAQGHTVRQSDWNVEFYDFFIGPQRVAEARRRLEAYVERLGDDHDDYRNQALFSLGILADYPDKKALAERLRSPACLDSVEDFYLCVTAFKRLLHAFSIAEPVVEVGTSSLTVAKVMRHMDSVHAFTSDDEANPFLPFFKAKVAAIASAPRYFGLSVIGTEQLLAGLTLGRLLKQRFPDTPIIIGGSVFSRLVDRDHDVLPLFGRYFDLVCRYEGEAPIHALLSAVDPVRERTPSLAFVEDSRVVKTDLVTPLSMEDIPTPDFEGLDLSRYYTPEIVLPLLTTRGCYWDKCAFCYHGMIYGDRYRMRSPERFAADLETLHTKHGVSHFALNDEAIPPKLFEKLPGVVPKGKYYFTGLYKFEKFFKPEHYQGMYDIGVRSLYIGLESASERVQRHMRKNNTQPVMLSNLRDAHAAGIWNHTFNFFGFPTETAEEATETAQFLIDNADIIHSEGTGTFSFEHNAPIFQNPQAFGIETLAEKPDSVLELYYDYTPTTGLSAAEARAFCDTFDSMKKAAGAYRYGGWIPREQLLVLLGRYGRDHLRSALADLDANARREFRRFKALSWFMLPGQADKERYFVVNSELGRIVETNRDAILLLEFLPDEAETDLLSSFFPHMTDLFFGGGSAPAPDGSNRPHLM